MLDTLTLQDTIILMPLVHFMTVDKSIGQTSQWNVCFVEVTTPLPCMNVTIGNMVKCLQLAVERAPSDLSNEFHFHESFYW